MPALAMLALAAGVADAAPRGVQFGAPPVRVEAYEVVELTLSVTGADAANPFTDAAVAGVFRRRGSATRFEVEGFCDADDGSAYRIRFMPATAGEYAYDVSFKQGAFEKRSSGSFRAVAGRHKGPIRVDPAFPWHFAWEGTGEHYFFNGTTAYWLMGWKDEAVIRAAIDRLRTLKVNRMRVTLAGRTNVFYGEPVMDGDTFTVMRAAWPGTDRHDIYRPGFDFSRFDLDHWRRWDRMLAYARDRDMIVSVVLDMNDSHVHPDAGSEDEHRFVRYAVDRLAAFANVTWDLGDDLDSYRDEAWTHDTGTLIKSWDPYRHLATSHPVDNKHQDRAAPWFDFCSFQEWSRDQHRFMLGQRAQQEKLGRIIPQCNEEYGYEDHYPLWAQGAGSESADVLRRTAWDICMAGGYQTAGETARRGTNIWPDTGGGWMNGRGDDTMTMFHGYARLVEFFTGFAWWRTAPHDELADHGAWCLADPGRTYALYLPRGGAVTVQLAPGRYAARWFDVRAGTFTTAGPAEAPSWTSPPAPSADDWALLLERRA